MNHQLAYGVITFRAVRTAIGQRLKFSAGTLATASVVAALVVAADLGLVVSNHYEGRGVLAVVALAINVWLVQGDLGSIGLRLTPVQGWWCWVWLSVLIGVAVAACIVVGLGAWVLTGHDLPDYTTAPGEIGTALLGMCLFAPVLEETIYRLALCMPLVALFGPWPAIAASGLAFGGLHFAYGNPSPENLLGGWFLAWAYLKSDSIVVPVVLHGLGNLCLLIGRVGTWYWLTSTG